jgi:membrane protein DedA with SNARE-associated domain
MTDWVVRWLETLADAPPALLYAVTFSVAFAENLFPPVPSDVVALLGGFLAARGPASVLGVGLSVWLGNVAGAMTIYAVGHRYGLAFFRGPWGRWLLRPHQLDRLRAVYRRHGLWVIFGSRFLPMFRAVVPIFAGVSHLRWPAALLPMALASGLWYGVLVALGSWAGVRWAWVQTQLHRVGVGLWLLSVTVLALVLAWWWRTRHARPREPAAP